MTRLFGPFGLSVVLLASACGSAQVQSAPPPKPCNLGPKVEATPLTIPGYPGQQPTITDADRAAMKARVPGWELTSIHTDGFPISIRRQMPDATLDERVTAVRTAMKALANEYGISTELVVEALAQGIQVSFKPAAFENPHVAVSVSSGDKSGWVTIAAVEGAPRLPARVHDQSDAELLATWGTDFQTREQQVTVDFPGQPCDPVVGHEDACAGMGPRSDTSCEAVKEPGTLWRGALLLPDGLHRIAMVPRQQGDGRGMVRRASNLPTCWDSVTGAFLEEAVCQRARFYEDHGY